MFFDSKKIFLAVCFSVIFCFAEEIVAKDAKRKAKPNIIYVMADDLGFGDLGCYGQKIIPTPNIDRLASEGMKFTDHYAGHTVCRPSRLVLMTGYHTGHTAIRGNARFVLAPEDLTVTELLQQAGYATGGIGKWALGMVGETGHPNQKGFDFWFGYLDQSDAHNYYPDHLWKNEESIPQPGNVVGPNKNVSIKKETYSHDEMTREALGFIKRSAGGPFFLQAHYTIPHTNNEAGRINGDGMEVPDYGMFADRDWPNPEKGFAAMVVRLDRDMGQFIDLLKELGIDENTLFIFTSDNGPHHEGGHDHEFFDSNGPLNGYKRSLHDGGIRVPMIARWPGTIEVGTISDLPCAFWDFLPTACEVAGIKPPKGIDGISYLPTLLGKKQPAHDYLFWRTDKVLSVRKGPWRGLLDTKSGKLELFDLGTDIGEQNDISAQHPDIVAEMRAIMDEAVTND